MPYGFFDHHAGKAAIAVGAANQAGLGQAGGTLIDKLRRNRKIKYLVSARAELTIDFGKPLLEFLIIGSFHKTAGDKMKQRGEFAPAAFRQLAARERLDAAVGKQPVLLVVQRFERKTQNRKFRPQRTVQRQVVERRPQLLIAQIARPTPKQQRA